MVVAHAQQNDFLLMSGDVILDDASLSGDKKGRSFLQVCIHTCENLHYLTQHQEMADLHLIYDAGVSILLSRLQTDDKKLSK